MPCYYCLRHAAFFAASVIATVGGDRVLFSPSFLFCHAVDNCTMTECPQSPHYCIGVYK